MNQQGRNLVKSSEKMLDNLIEITGSLEKMVFELTKKMSLKERELLLKQFEDSKLIDIANKMRKEYKDLQK